MSQTSVSMRDQRWLSRQTHLMILRMTVRSYIQPFLHWIWNHACESQYKVYRVRGNNSPQILIVFADFTLMLSTLSLISFVAHFFQQKPIHAWQTSSEFMIEINTKRIVTCLHLSNTSTQEIRSCASHHDSSVYIPIFYGELSNRVESAITHDCCSFCLKFRLALTHAHPCNYWFGFFTAMAQLLWLYQHL